MRRWAAIVAAATMTGLSVQAVTGAAWAGAQARAAGSVATASAQTVSCASAGNCVAGGTFTDKAGHRQAFVVSERNGHWGTAIEVPGTGRLNAGGNAFLFSVSCASPGNCGAGGFYRDGSNNQQAFVVSERNGHWGRAIEVPRTAKLNVGGVAEVTSVSCPSAGNCSAGGAFKFGSVGPAFVRAFVVNQVAGVWHGAVAVTGVAAGSIFSHVDSVSCPSAGNCGAGGGYVDRALTNQALVVSERNGHWGKAIEVPGSGKLNVKGGADVTSVSCRSAGNCSAGGFYSDKSGAQQVFVVNERNGHWGLAQEVPGSGMLNAGRLAELNELSCGSTGNCGAGGSYVDRSNHIQAFVVTSRNGTWGKAQRVPGLGRLNTGGAARINSLSCPSAGNCGAGGFFTARSGATEAFVVNERHGRWSTAIEVPGIAFLNKGRGAEVNSVSCPSAGNCAATGSYTSATANQQAFVASETHGSWRRAQTVRF